LGILYKKKKKRRKNWKEGRAVRVKGFGGLIFFIIQNPLILGTKKFHWRRNLGGFWRVKVSFSNLCFYNTFKVRNTLIISTNLSFFTKPHSLKI